MVVVPRLARDEAASVEPADALLGFEQGKRAVDGCQADRSSSLAGGAPELLGGEGVLLRLDELG
jgi:hypothetical protein